MRRFDRNLFPFFLTTGCVFKGLIPKRDNDVLAAGVVYGRYSEDLRNIQSSNNQELQYQETVFEANYKISTKRILVENAIAGIKRLNL